MPAPARLDPEQLRPWRQTGAGLLIFTDFDGTLVPIKDNPDACRLDAEGQGVLAALAAQTNTRIAVVSGRLLSDLRPRVGLSGIGYAGNHGLEIDWLGQSFREPTAVWLQPVIASLAEKLRHAVADLPGAWVQDKELTLSVHYRLVAAEQVPEVVQRVSAICQPWIDDGRVALRPGKRVIEVRPAVVWHKGTATRWMAERSGLASPLLVVYVGDDETDEDAFAAWPEGLTIRVGAPRESQARWRLDGPPDVLALFRELRTH